MTEPIVQSSYRFGRFELQPDQQRLLVDGVRATVNPRAFDLLVALVERAGHLVTKDELLELVWPGLVVEENNLQVQVSALRKILGQEAIATVPGRGYRFTSALGREDAITVPVPAALKHNLPLLLTGFIGHESDLAEYARLLEQTRLLTLTGIGGCGKTRLAIKLAERLLPSFPDGVRFVDLASVAEPERVAFAVATTLGVLEEGDKPIEETLTRHLADGQLLLLLDNCEHLLGACAALLEPLLRSAPGLRVVVTSREGLGIAGERTVPVRSLSLPPPGSAQDPETVGGFEAVCLFVERARHVAPEFSLSPSNAPAVAEICRRLDGIPLAIELAAARVKLLSPDQIRAKLDDRFRLLTGSSRAVSRHQTLLATLQWSYEHLPPDEQQLLRSLSVFAGGWTLEAATAIAEQCWDEVDVVDRLGHLVDKSLVLVERQAPDAPRYGMLETVRQYAQDRLNETGQSNAVRERHLVHFLALARTARMNFDTENVREWLRRVDLELPNLLAAHVWCDQARDGANQGLELARNLRGYWIQRGLYALGQQVSDEALGREGVDPRSICRGEALFSLGQHHYFRGRLNEAFAPLEEALAIAREHGDDELTVNCLDKIGLAHVFLGNAGRALECVTEELSLARRTGIPLLIHTALTANGAIWRVQGDFDAATEAFEQALSSISHDDYGHRHGTLVNLARVSIAHGATAPARERLAQAIRLLSEMGATYSVRARLALEVASRLAARREDWHRAARLQGTADAAADKMGGIANPFDDPVLKGLHTKPREMLGAMAYAAAYEMGRRIALEEGLAEALGWLQESDES